MISQVCHICYCLKTWLLKNETDLKRNKISVFVKTAPSLIKNCANFKSKTIYLNGFFDPLNL